MHKLLIKLNSLDRL